MAEQPTPAPRLEHPDALELDRSRRAFLLARAQLAADQIQRMRLDAAHRKWSVHRRRFS
jgi:hypothetical protein